MFEFASPISEKRPRYAVKIFSPDLDIPMT